MSSFHKAVKRILAEVDSFINTTLRTEKLTTAAQGRRTKVLEALRDFYSDHQDINPNAADKVSTGTASTSTCSTGYVDIADSTVKALINPNKIGYLTKKTPDLKDKLAKHKKYCVVHQNVFYWFKKPRDEKQQGAFVLTGCVFKDRTRRDKEFLFEVVLDRDKSFLFQADSREDVIEWRKAIEEAAYIDEEYVNFTEYTDNDAGISHNTTTTTTTTTTKVTTMPRKPATTTTMTTSGSRCRQSGYANDPVTPPQATAAADTERPRSRPRTAIVTSKEIYHVPSTTTTTTNPATAIREHDGDDNNDHVDYSENVYDGFDDASGGNCSDVYHLITTPHNNNNNNNNNGDNGSTTTAIRNPSTKTAAIAKPANYNPFKFSNSTNSDSNPNPRVRSVFRKSDDIPIPQGRAPQIPKTGGVVKSLVAAANRATTTSPKPPPPPTTTSKTSTKPPATTTTTTTTTTTPSPHSLTLPTHPIYINDTARSAGSNTIDRKTHHYTNTIAVDDDDDDDDDDIYEDI